MVSNDEVWKQNEEIIGLLKALISVFSGVDKSVNVDNFVDKSKSEVWTAPTVDEIKTYCFGRRNLVDADKFFNFYSSKGWMIGKNRMKDWRSAVREPNAPAVGVMSFSPKSMTSSTE